MKTKNVKVRAKDLKQGVTVYTACPWYGGTKRIVITGKPKKHADSGFYSVSYEAESYIYPGELTQSYFCLGDYGMPDSYGNDKRVFFKRKHAEEYIRRVKSDPQAIARQEKHLASVALMDDWERCSDCE